MEKTVYLDHSATTPVLEVVAQRMLPAMQHRFYNPSAAYGPAVEAERALRACRDTLRDAAGAQGYEVIFTSGGTEADNLAILGVLERLRGPGVCCYSAVEHPAVREPMRAAEAAGRRVRVLPVDARGVLDLERCAPLLDGEVALISCMHVCNETGAMQPIEALAALREERCPGALLHVDGVQGFLRAALPARQLGVDLYALSAHKIHGPKGAGALLVRKGVALKPQLLGGGQEGGLRSGTENVPGILGMQAAVEALGAMPELAKALREKKLRLWRRVLAGEPCAQANGPDPESTEAAPHILNFSLPGVRGEVMLHALEAAGVYVSTGAACSARRQRHSPALTAMGIAGERLEGAIRISLSPLNTPEEMDLAAGAILAAHAQLKGFRRR
ncbi:MAG: cysteine desulfurase [Clostridia bacterium]|nr:cysteine desulfurase [Clostridia bacterium]